MNIDDIIAAIDGLSGDDLARLRRKATEAFLKEDHQVVRDAINALFEKHPYVQAVRWDQYTPYFNDGDACEFHVHEARVKIDPVGNEGWDEEFMDEWTVGYELEKRGAPSVKPLRAAIEALNRALSEREDALEELFGDDAEVTVVRGEDPVVSRCSHD